MSHELVKKVKQVGIESGVWRGIDDDPFTRIPELKSAKNVALDYGALWMDPDI